MIFFNDEKSKKLLNLLKQSKQDFRFDPANLKAQLIQDISARRQTVFHPVRMRIWHTFEYGVALAAMVIFVSATFVFAGNSQPGDRLFPISKLSEKVILSLPLTAAQKARVQTQIVTKRLKALNDIDNSGNTKILETVRESDESLSNAIETVSVKRDDFQAAGNTKAAEPLNEVLGQLENLASEHEQRVEIIRQKMEDKDVQNEIDGHLQQIKHAKRKAMQELRHEEQQNNDSQD